MTRERIERVFKNLVSALGHCVVEEGGLVPAAAFAFVAVWFLGMFRVIGVVVYDSALDPHFTKASLDAVSISPDRWIPR